MLSLKNAIMSKEDLTIRASDYLIHLDKKVLKTRGIDLSRAEFSDILTTLEYPETLSGQAKMFESLNKLSVEKLLDKTNKIAKLVKVLHSIKRNRKDERK